MALITIGIGDCAVTSDPDATLVTYGLGSCIAVAAWDPETRASGLRHFMLPSSEDEAGRSRDNPFLFADTGMQGLLRKLINHRIDPAGLVLRAAGGANILDGPSLFNVGQKNEESLLRVLLQMRLTLSARDTGGKISRTLRLDARTGRCWVENANQVVELAVRQSSFRRTT